MSDDMLRFFAGIGIAYVIIQTVSYLLDLIAYILKKTNRWRW